ncbi:MAG: ParB/RepB/Spo0J family partition protein [Frankiaceae bacterium]|nr:ParB/RepB/Spo0J family partition protein [Frankiaceae bacterium]MBV9870356.1 ParB/RepB/Spo0J family partition protein [Frankiaceae bacterium]
MNVRRGGLGRGLGALIPAGPIDEDPTGARFEDLPVDSIEPNPRQPREVFDEDALAELVTSIREVGVLQPVVVRETGPGRYQLVMGERRLRASREAGQTTIPAIIRETNDDALLRDALLENLHRQQLNPLEEAAAYQQLLAEFGATHEELAERIGRSRSQVSNTIRLLGLPPTVQRRVAAGVISAGHARALLTLGDADAQERLAARIVSEGLSVRATEELVTIDEEPAAPRSRGPRPAKVPALARLEEALSDRLETKVTVELGRRRGKLSIAFASLDDLHRILGDLAPGVMDEESPPE